MSSADAIRAIVSGYPQRLWSRKPLAMLQTFIDDSNCRGGDRRLFLAGYVQSAEAWIEFSKAWDDALREEPAIDYLKMSEAHGRWEQFKGFSEKKRNRKLACMADVIAQFSPLSFHTSISVAEFETILKPFVPFPMTTPYFYVFQAMALGVARSLADLGVTEPTRLIFDRQDGLAGKVVPVFETMFDSAPDHWRKLVTGVPQFEDDKTVLPLQAADMLVWHLRREHEGQYPEEYRGMLSQITVEGMSSFTTIKAEHLQLFADEMKTRPVLQEIGKKEWKSLAPIYAQTFGAK